MEKFYVVTFWIVCLIWPCILIEVSLFLVNLKKLYMLDPFLVGVEMFHLSFSHLPQMTPLCTNCKTCGWRNSIISLANVGMFNLFFYLMLKAFHRGHGKMDSALGLVWFRIYVTPTIVINSCYLTAVHFPKRYQFWF